MGPEDCKKELEEHKRERGRGRLVLGAGSRGGSGDGCGLLRPFCKREHCRKELGRMERRRTIWCQP